MKAHCAIKARVHNFTRNLATCTYSN